METTIYACVLSMYVSVKANKTVLSSHRLQFTFEYITLCSYIATWCKMYAQNYRLHRHTYLLYKPVYRLFCKCIITYVVMYIIFGIITYIPCKYRLFFCSYVHWLVLYLCCYYKSNIILTFCTLPYNIAIIIKNKKLHWYI